MTTPVDDQRRLRLVLIILFAVFCFSCISIFWIFFADSGLRADLSEFRANRWLKSTYSDVMQITNDTKLQESYPPQVSVGGTMACVSGSVWVVFGTDRSYSEVVKSYSDWLLDHDWREGEIPENVNTSLTNLYYVPHDSLSRTIVLAPSSIEDQKAEYHTIYSVTIDFTELRCAEFCPAWRCPEKEHVDCSQLTEAHRELCRIESDF